MERGQRSRGCPRSSRAAPAWGGKRGSTAGWRSRGPRPRAARWANGPSCLDPLERRAQRRRQCRGPARISIDIDMHEMALRAGGIGVVGKDSDLIAHARRADTRHAQARVHRLRKRQLAEVPALRFDDQPDDLAALDVEHARSDEVLVDDGVEVRVVHDIVDVPVGVVVHPARRDRMKVTVLAPAVRRFACAHAFPSVRRTTSATPIIVTSTPAQATAPSRSPKTSQASNAVIAGVRYIRLATWVARPRRIITSSSEIATSDRATIDHTSASQNSTL